MSERARILVIKLGGLGDFVQACGAFARIREAHRAAAITLLTTEPYRDFAAASPYFDRVETDGRPRKPSAYLRLFRRLRRARYRRVYDLQTSGRTRNYIIGFWPRPPEWSGISPGASHRQRRPDRDALHNLDRLADQMRVAGIAPAFPLGEAPAPDLGWAVAAARGQEGRIAPRFGLSPPFALLAPGASPRHPWKCWPAERYAALAAALVARGVRVAVIGGPGEAEAAKRIAAAASAVDLTGRTRMIDLAGLAAEAALCVGNDTGPTHLAAYAGAPGAMLMSTASRVGHCEPRARMRTITVPDLRSLVAGEVIAALSLERVGGDLSIPATPQSSI